LSWRTHKRERKRPRVRDVGFASRVSWPKTVEDGRMRGVGKGKEEGGETRGEEGAEGGGRLNQVNQA